MRKHSVYSVDCVCGHHIETETPSLICPGCGRQVEVQWPAQSERTEAPQQTALLIAA